MKYEMSKVSMKMYAKNFIMVLLALAFGVMLRAVPAEAAVTETLATEKTGTVIFYRDLTGDGVTERVSITALKAASNKSWYNKLAISVNGKKVATLNSDLFFNYDVRYVSASETRQFLEIEAYGANPGITAMHSVYRYNAKTGNLIKVLELLLKNEADGTITKITSNTVTVRYYRQFFETATLDWDFAYTYKNGKYKLKSNKVNVRSTLRFTTMGDGYDKYFQNNKFLVFKSKTFYTGTSLSKKAFTAKKGDVLKLEKICVINKKTYLCFSKNGKTGWIRVGISHKSVYGNNSYNGWFYGTGRRLGG